MERSRNVSTGLRYALFQVPGTAIVGALMFFAVRVGWIDGQTALVAVAVGIVKDAALYPLLRRAYQRGDDSYHAKLVGRVGCAREDLTPSGYVSIAGELWRARVRPGDPAVRAGARVVVCGNDSGRLIVTADHGAETVRST